MNINDYIETDNHEEFVAYLREQLIPDLYESGRDETAEDSARAADFIEKLSMSAEERVSRAFQDWVEQTDPPPTGMDLSSWVQIARQANITTEELNEVGRSHWGKYWPEGGVK